MLEHSTVRPNGDDAAAPYARPFLTTHRALAVCGREIERLTGEIVRGVTALRATGAVDEKAVVRQSPGRCIVQLGPVALTVTWLRRAAVDSIADGQLLAIVWRGAVASRVAYSSREPVAPGPATAVTLWEESFVVDATNEETWRWQPDTSDAEGYSSSALADRCVDQLLTAHTGSRASA